MIDFLQNVDTQLFLAFNGQHAPFFDSFMMFITGRFVWAPMYAAIPFMLFRMFAWRKAVVLALCIIAVIAATDMVIADLIRPFCARFRPGHPMSPIADLVHNVNGYRGGKYGFPSCHGGNSFALATFMSLLVNRRRFTLFIFVWAFLHSYSRLYLGVHYPGDLIVGAVIGSAMAWIIWHVSATLLRHFSIADNEGHCRVIVIPEMSYGNVISVRAIPLAPCDVISIIGCVTFVVAIVYASVSVSI